MFANLLFLTETIGEVVEEVIEKAPANNGLMIAIIGACIATVVSGIGSILGVQMCGRAAAGVTTEQPELFGKLLVLQILPGTQGLYGFLAAVLLMLKIGLVGGSAGELSNATGWAYFAACMPITINGLISAWYQAKVATSAIMMTAKQPDASGKGITMAVLVETYAILSLIVSILLIFGIN